MQNTLKRVSILSAALLPVFVLGFFLLKSDSPEEEAAEAAASIAAAKREAPAVVADATVSVPSTGTVASVTFADGTYAAAGSYTSPAGAETIGVSVTLANDVITAVTMTAEATNTTSKLFQEAFIEGSKTMILGKNIADVQVGKISGSSLTPKGFEAALNAIKTQAAV